MVDAHSEEISPLRILVAENIPSLNKGEMTILEGMLDSFKILGKVEVIMFSRFPEIDQPRYGAKIKVIDVKKLSHISDKPGKRGKVLSILASFFPLFQHLLFLILYKTLRLRALRLVKSEIWKEYVESDVIILGHNGAFGIGGLAYFYYFYMPFFARMLGKPVVLYGGSISRFRRIHWLLEKGAKFALSKIDLITLREGTSCQYLKEMGIQSEKVFLTADPAFLLQPASVERVKEIMEREGIDESSRPLVGMTVSREIASTAFPILNSPEDSYHKHIEVVAQVIDHLTDKLNATVFFLPHCIGFGEKLDDRIVAKDILQLCSNKDKVKVINNEYGAGELKGLIGQFNLFIGERVHSVINAMSMGVPSVALLKSTDQRQDIIRMLGQVGAICHVENLDNEALLSKIGNIWVQKEKIRQELKSQVEDVRERARLNGKLLKELLDSRKI